VSEERSHFAQRIDEKRFRLARRGYDKREVRAYLEDLEQAFRELEGHARRSSQRVADLEHDLADARATEKVSVDNAMMAVFDAKDRILERARRRADEIEEQAHSEAGRIKAAAISGASASGSGEVAAASAQADEIVASARREADRIRRDAEEGATRDLEAELDAVTAQLRRAHADTASAKEQLDGARKRIVELESGATAVPSADLEARFTELESLLTGAREENSRLTDQLEQRARRIEVLEKAAAMGEASGAGSTEQDQEEYEAALAAGEKMLVESRKAIAELESRIALSDPSRAEDQVDALLAAAREEAEAIKSEAEEEAEQRAAKVIAKAREEADQVRQTVATLTAQAEDARSAALRSKLEAENLAEAQRSIGKANEDLVATAKGRAREIEDEARQSAERILLRAEEELARAKAEAEQIKAESAQAAVAAPTSEELAEMLAETEQEVAISRELRLQREELAARARQLEERERALDARQLDEAKTRLESREPPVSRRVEPMTPGPEETSGAKPDGDAGDRLGALLEAAAMAAGDGKPEQVSVDLEAGEPAEPHPRVAWPAPNRRTEAEREERETVSEDLGNDTEEEEDEDETGRRSRYRSRSAQLPRLGRDEESSSMTSMANLRKKSRKGH